MVRVHDLGPLRLDIEGVPQSIGGRLAAVMAALVVRLGQTVTSEWLADAIWGAELPGHPFRSLDTLVWRLRRLLEPQRASRAWSVLVTEENGYRLVVPPSAVDSHVLADSVELVRKTVRQGDFDAALETSDRVLDLWRGVPYQGIADDGWLEPVRTRLGDQRVELCQLRVDALLRSGQPERAVHELTPLLAEHPLREPLWGRQMLGLYRSGRYSEALEAYAQIRTILRDELGVEPGRELRDMQRQVLVRDPGLDDPARVRVRPVVQLPRSATPLIGREDEQAQLGGLVAICPEVTVTGPMGCGKTRLAVEVAGKLSESFNGGVWFIDLSALRDETRVADAVAGTIGLDVAAGSPALDAVGSFAGARQALFLLDNCEQIAGGVAHFADVLTQAGPGLRILATSREPLGAGAEREFRLAPLPLPSGPSPAELEASASARLLVRRMLDGGRKVDLDGPDSQAVAAICRATDGLPLALELAAARARTFELQEVADSLTRYPGDLADLGGRRSGRQLTMRDSIEWSYQLVSAEEQAVHRRLSVLPAGITLDAATAVCADVTRPGQVADVLAALAYKSLLERSRPERSGGSTMFRQLEVVRAHAAAALAAAAEESAVITARDLWVSDWVGSGPRLGRPGQADWYGFLDDNYATVSAVLQEAMRPGHAPVSIEDAMLTVTRLSQYWLDTEQSVEAHRWLRRGIEVADAGGTGEYPEAAMRAAYGGTLAADQRMNEAMPHIRKAFPVLAHPDVNYLRDAADTLTELAAHAFIGDDFVLARQAALTAAGHGETLEDPHVVIAARAVAATALAELGELEQAKTETDSILAENEAIGNDMALMYAYIEQSVAADATASAADGLIAVTNIMRCKTRMGVRNIGDTLESRGDHSAIAGQQVEAVRCLAASRSHSEHRGRSWPRLPRTAQNLEALRATLPAAEFQRAWESGERLDIGNLPVDWL
jgi:predicted ATPase